MVDVDHVSGFGPSWHRFEILAGFCEQTSKSWPTWIKKWECSESRDLQLSFLILVEFCEQTSKYWRRRIMCQGLDPHDTDLKYIVGFCEQTSKEWPTWIKKINVFRITSSTTSIFNFSRILWTNFKKLTEVDQKMRVFRITSSTTFIFSLMDFKTEGSLAERVQSSFSLFT